MLMALLIVSLLGAGVYEIFSNDEFRHVQQAIEEPERADRAIMVMRRVNRLNDQLEDRRTEIVSRLAELNQDRSTPAEDYQRVFDELWQARAEVFGHYQTDVFQLRAQMTREEWEHAFGLRESGR
jgi:type II secretory pathway component PulJ